MMWAPPACSTSPGAAGASLHPGPLKWTSWSFPLFLGELSAGERIRLLEQESISVQQADWVEVPVSIGLIASTKSFPGTSGRFCFS